MKVVSYTALFYGVDYLPYALRSVNNVIDLSFIVYTPHPSQSHNTDIKPLETSAELFGSIEGIDKVMWKEVHKAYHEHEHRNAAVNLCKEAGADLILVLDYDEVWHEDVLRKALDFVWEKNSARDWLINFTHLWRSFNWCCKDDLWPVRIIDTRHSEGVGYVPKELGDIYHLGYCIRTEVMEYKWQIQGHHNELRSNWFSEKWVWPPVRDCHPTNERDWWIPKEFDKSQLPEVLKSHPFYSLEYIP